METQEEPKLKTRYLGRRIYSLYVLKKKNQFHSASQITVLGHALYDQIKAGKASTDADARENLIRLLCNEDLRYAPLHEFIEIPLGLTKSDFYYVGPPIKTYVQKIMTRQLMHHELGGIIDEIKQHYGDIKNAPKTFNCLAVVEQRDASSSKTGLISLSDGKPIEERVKFAGNFAIYKIALKIKGSIVDFHQPPGGRNC